MARYVTVEELLAARADLEDSMPGWRSPIAYALGVEVDGADIQWRVTNYPNTHTFPAMTLGKVLGHRGGSATYWLDLAPFDEAIALLEPAGACQAFEHPNLWAWQGLRAELPESGLPAGMRIVVVFIGDEGDPVVDDANRQLRASLSIV